MNEQGNIVNALTLNSNTTESNKWNNNNKCKYNIEIKTTTTRVLR